MTAIQAAFPANHYLRGEDVDVNSFLYYLQEEVLPFPGTRIRLARLQYAIGLCCDANVDLPPQIARLRFGGKYQPRQDVSTNEVPTCTFAEYLCEERPDVPFTMDVLQRPATIRRLESAIKQYCILAAAARRDCDRCVEQKGSARAFTVCRRINTTDANDRRHVQYGGKCLSCYKVGSKCSHQGMSVVAQRYPLMCCVQMNNIVRHRRRRPALSSWLATKKMMVISNISARLVGSRSSRIRCSSRPGTTDGRAR
ncbi:hypothetical protein BU23DRAFT_559729 [Bimuria novae-zelandiae CBS 107.79]|uniref:Uncharacterized protein n=1 Tax=Bimuria novae-zelandiae CBS 107.79 TaxID=1447943 RepID=A0A6A5UQY4_9PLEO|nr:hypothetical protein BU23DRAFT_559729 [Bimuria novae-zelandiae CBS 107.79]